MFAPLNESQPRSNDMTLATAMVGGGVGIGYIAFRLFSQGRGGGRTPGEGQREDYPMLDMADIARRAVPRKKSFLYTRRGDKGTSQVQLKAACILRS